MKIDISPFNKFVKYADEDNQLVLAKSDKNQELFDDLIFVNRNAINVKIPKYIKKIHQYSFGNCFQLKNIDFDDDSDLETIGSYAFYDCNINHIILPKKICKINEDLLANSDYLFCIEFLGDHIICEDNFLNCPRIVLISFPNTKFVEIPDDFIDDIMITILSFGKITQNIFRPPYEFYE